MSTIPTPPAPTPPASSSPTKTFSGLWRSIFIVEGKPGEVVIISHSMLLYWWPVWLTSFILAGITYFKDAHAAFVPAHIKLVHVESAKFAQDPGPRYKDSDFDAIITENNAPFPHLRERDDGTPFTPSMHPNSSLGIVFAVVLLITIVITSAHMRGLWSVVTILVISLIAFLFALFDWWGTIVERILLLNIHINMGGYLSIGLVLFIIWLVSFLFFDRQTYLVVSAGQVRVRLEIGGGETVYDPTGIVFHKRRSDFFRHLFVGFGSGDLVIRPSQTKEIIELPNVLRVSKRVKQIEQLLRERQLVSPA